MTYSTPKFPVARQRASAFAAGKFVALPILIAGDDEGNLKLIAASFDMRTETEMRKFDVLVL